MQSIRFKSIFILLVSCFLSGCVYLKSQEFEFDYIPRNSDVYFSDIHEKLEGIGFYNIDEVSGAALNYSKNLYEYSIEFEHVNNPRVRIKIGCLSEEKKCNLSYSEYVDRSSRFSKEGVELLKKVEKILADTPYY